MNSKVKNTTLSSHSLEKNINVKINYSQPKKIYKIIPSKNPNTNNNNNNNQDRNNLSQWKYLNNSQARKSAFSKFLGNPMIISCLNKKKKNHSAETQFVTLKNKIKFSNNRHKLLKLAIPKFSYLRSSDQIYRKKLIKQGSKSKKKQEIKRSMFILKGSSRLKKPIANNKMMKLTSQNTTPTPKNNKLKFEPEVKSFEINNSRKISKELQISHGVIRDNFIGNYSFQNKDISLQNNIKKKYNILNRSNKEIEKIKNFNLNNEEKKKMIFQKHSQIKKINLKKANITKYNMDLVKNKTEFM